MAAKVRIEVQTGARDFIPGFLSALEKSIQDQVDIRLNIEDRDQAGALTNLLKRQGLMAVVFIEWQDGR